MLLEITSLCGGRCPGCPTRERQHPPVPLSQWELWIKSLRHQVSDVLITGGEPTCYEEFTGLCRFLESLELRFGIFTNGCWPAPAAVIETLRECSAFSGFLFSIHGANRLTHFRFTGDRNLEMLEEHLAAARELEAPLYAFTVIGEHNKHQIKEMVRNSLKAGVKAHFFNRYIGPVREGISIDRKDLEKISGLIGEMRLKGLPVEMVSCFPPGPGKCGGGRSFCVLDADGGIRPCAFTSFAFGNLLQSPWQEIWQSPGARRWREEIRSVEGSESRPPCRGGCPVFTHDYGLEQDPFIDGERPESASKALDSTMHF